MTWRCRAVLVGYPTAANIEAWTPEVGPDHPHVVAEGV